MNPAIIVVAYNRVKSLQRLLESLSNADYSSFEDISLVVSVDEGDNASVLEIANSFHWPYGEKIVLQHKQRLGLRKHILQCGDLAEKYGSIILLEDDLYVSPYFYVYAVDALAYYESDDSISGVSLYSHKINELAERVFEPISDGYDVFFLKRPSSWGQAWTCQQWTDFRKWYENEFSSNQNFSVLPPDAKAWPKSSWKKIFLLYMVQNDKIFVYPRTSLTTNFGDIGTHFEKSKKTYQVSLLSQKMSFRFCPLNDSVAVYDTFMEILPESIQQLNPTLTKFDFEVDLYGTKLNGHIKKEFILTSKDCTQSIVSFARELKPHECNIISNLPGDVFKLCDKSLLIEKQKSSKCFFHDIHYDFPFQKAKKSLIFSFFQILSELWHRVRSK